MPAEHRAMATWHSWLLGFLLSVGFIWVVSFFWGERAHLRVFDPVIGRCVNCPGWTEDRREGGAVTFVGKHGINLIPDISAIPTRKLAIVGDSFVEAFQVHDNAKMQSRFNAAWPAAHEEELLAFGLARSASGVADYYFEIPVLNEIAAPIGAYAIVVAQIKDLYPVDILDPGEVDSKFYAYPAPHFERNARKDCQPRSKWLIASTRTDFLLPLTRTLRRKGIESLRFTPGPLPVAVAEDETAVPPPPVEAWEFMVSELKRVAGRALVFVYLPAVPTLSDGSVSFADPYADRVDAFAAVCRAKGVDFINMADRFNAFYLHSRKFPRGFPDTLPGEGHLNEYGHELVADMLLEYSEEHLDAILAD